MLDWVCMVYQKRASAPSNTVKLTLDYDTLDRLKALASERRVDATRCAYELLQEALGMRAARPQAPTATPLDELEDRMGELLTRINQPPKGSA